jgi:hypothetical protein
LQLVGYAAQKIEISEDKKTVTFHAARWAEVE